VIQSQSALNHSPKDQRYQRIFNWEKIQNKMINKIKEILLVFSFFSKKKIVSFLYQVK